MYIYVCGNMVGTLWWKYDGAVQLFAGPAKQNGRVLGLVSRLGVLVLQLMVLGPQ